jgi:hypothetical protein
MKYQKLDENRKHGKNEHNKIMERIYNLPLLVMDYVTRQISFLLYMPVFW